MKSIANQYRDLKEGRMSQANFMRNLRMTMPQYVTNTTSFGDAVRILKNKSIIVESHAGNDQWLDAFQDALGFKTYMSPSYLISQYGDMKPEDAARKFMDDSTESAMAKDKEKSARETGLEEGDEELDTMVKKMEDRLAEEIDTNKVYGGTGQNQGDTGSSLQFTVIKDTPEYFEIDFTLTPNSRYRQAGAGSRSPREKEYGYVKVSKADFDGWIKAKGENFYIGKDFIANNLQSDNEFDAMIKAVEDEKAGEEAVKAQYDEELNEAKKKEEKIYHVHQVNPTELRLGIRTELEHGDMELDKAKEIAYKNITKDPIYYTTLKLSGVEAHPKKVKGEKEVPAKKKKEAIQLVDLVNGMQKVKMPKKDEKKKLKEGVDEAMPFADLPADPGKYKIVKDSKGYIIKATNADGIEFQKGDVVKTYDGEEIKIAKFEESQGKVKAIYSTGMFFRGIDIDGLEAPKPTMRPGVDMGASFEKMKKSMQEIVRETISEYFDGRDNLIDPLAAEEENN
jgi:hypothetical protein